MDHHHRRRGHWHHQRLKRDHSNRPITKVHFVTLDDPVAGSSTVPEVKKTKKTTQPKKPVGTTKAPSGDKPKQTQKSTPPPVTTTPSTKVVQPPSRPTTTSISRAPDTTQSWTQGSSTKQVPSSPASYTIDSPLRTSDRTQKPTSIASTGAHRSGGVSVGVIIGGCLLTIIFFVFIAVFFYRKRKQRAQNKAYGGVEDEKSAGLVSGAAATAGFSGGASINEKTDNVSLRTITQSDSNLDPPAASPVVKTGPSGGTGRHAIPRKPIPSPLVLSKPLQPDLQPTTTSAVQNPSVIPTAQPSPTLSAFSGSSVPGTPAQDPVNAPALIATGKPTPVHRVQMDYSPIQPDELEIRTGQLVRMLHAYDDGWALCVRMDRSQQGVCPRTCLSDRPVKPRPNPSLGSPVNQQRRAQTPTNSQPPQNSQKYIPYSGSRPGTSPQHQHPQRPETSQPQPIPQITVSRVESDPPETKYQQESKSTSSPANPDAPTFHAM